MKKYKVIQTIEYEIETFVNAENTEEAYELAREIDKWSEPCGANWTMNAYEMEEIK